VKVSIITFNDFTDLDLFILWDLLNRAESADWQVMLLGDQESHVSSTGIEIKMHGHLDEANSSDAVLFCSGKGTRKIINNQAYLDSFHFREAEQLIGAIDSGALILGALGLLKGKRATTYPVAETKRLLQGMGAEVVWEPFVQEGNIATAAQCLAGQHLAGWVIESFLGPQEKEKVLRTVAPLDLIKVSV